MLRLRKFADWISAGVNILVAQPESSRTQFTTNTRIAAEFIVELKRGGTGILVERIDTPDQVFSITLTRSAFG
jgi:hypothetical protein